MPSDVVGNWPMLVAGVLLLTLGRRLFWIALGVVGFVFGMELASRYLDDPANEAVVLIVGVLGGIAGALLALFFQRVALSLAGFFLGAATTFWLIQRLWPETGNWIWVAAIVAGVAGAVLASTLFEAALIVGSSLVGATLTTRALEWGEVPDGVALLILAAVGVLFQLYLWNRSRRPDPGILKS